VDKSNGIRERRDSISIDPIKISLEILRNYPLCDHCLGRVFAKLGLDLGNDERGKAIKTLLAMHLHQLLRNSIIGKEELRVYAMNAGDPVTRLYSKIYEHSIEPLKCYICGNKLSRKYFETHAEKIYEILRKYDASSFLIGVSIPQEIMLKELEIASHTGLVTTESIKNEIKREVGKIIKNKYGIEPDFEHPDIVVIIEFINDEYRVVVNPILYEGHYWKRGRNISHTKWISRRGIKLYPYSIEEFISDRIRELFKASEIVHHASGREDVDARMLGTGRPVVIEVKNPMKRSISIDDINSRLSSTLIEVRIDGKSSRKRIEYLKGEGSKKNKVYKILVYTEDPIDQSKIVELENTFKNIVVRQRTPKRILRRKKDTLRKKHVHEVKATMIAPNIIEALVYCEGGLYVKELVHCDDGRTTPCFSEVLGTNAYPLELDVVAVEIE